MLVQIVSISTALAALAALAAPAERAGGDSCSTVAVAVAWVKERTNPASEPMVSTTNPHENIAAAQEGNPIRGS